MLVSILSFGVTRHSIKGLDGAQDFHFVPMLEAMDESTMELILRALSTPYIAIATMDEDMSVIRVRRQIEKMKVTSAWICGYACGPTLSHGSVVVKREYALTKHPRWLLPDNWVATKSEKFTSALLVTPEEMRRDIRLSILICHLTGRAASLAKLLEKLKPQLGTTAEVIVDSDDGRKPVGDKRNDLLVRASGDYVAFVGDDDMVSDDYVSKIVKATESNPDCCGITGVIARHGYEPKTFIQSLRYKQWRERDGVHYRSPGQFCPVKRDIALKAMFPDGAFADREYSARLLLLLKSEAFIEGPIYFYTSGDLQPQEAVRVYGVKPKKSAYAPQAYGQASSIVPIRVYAHREKQKSPYVAQAYPEAQTYTPDAAHGPPQDHSGDEAWEDHKARLSEQQRESAESAAKDAEIRRLVTETIRKANVEFDSLAQVRQWPEHAVATWPKQFLRSVVSASFERHEKALIQKYCEPQVWQRIVTMCVHNHTMMVVMDGDIRRLISMVKP